jgi:ABC-type polysaccharide/polyol phosphate transport system ATPase subunit
MTALYTKNLSKKYTIYPSPKYLFYEMFCSAGQSKFEERWAVKDVNLQIPAGETCAVIGKNGSGKSTLLGLFAGIITPTSGEVISDGCISSVLTLGAGFQEELSGRHNIYLTASIMGLSTNEIQRELDDIIEFSELMHHIDKPVKTYSSGMLMRLGFSIAVHVYFDILLIDEVLAVGDLLFARKCISRMRQFKEMGKTILLTSHNLANVAALCDRVILLDEGQILLDGPTESVIKQYWEQCEKEQNRIEKKYSLFKPDNIYGEDTRQIRITHVLFLNKEGEATDIFETKQPLTIKIGYFAKTEIYNPLFRVQFFRNDGLWVHGTNTNRQELNLGILKGEGEIQLHYEYLNLLEADYYVSIGIWPDEYKSFIIDVAYDYHEMAYIIHVKSSRRDGAGIVCNPFHWKLLRN